MDKPCQYCHNAWPEDIHADHEAICAKNPDQQEKARKASAIETATRHAVLLNGHIRRMYWQHSSLGVQEISVEEVLARWAVIYPEQNYTDPRFLKARNFNIIREAVSDGQPSDGA